MIGAEMVGILRDHAFERRDQLNCPVNRLAVECPQSPRMQVHHRFGEQRAGVGIVGIVMRNFAHRVRIRELQRVIHLAVGRVTLSERVNIFALERAGIRFE